jgi:N-acetylated-alpha-linked acidic dipeptidase
MFASRRNKLVLVGLAAAGLVGAALVAPGGATAAPPSVPGFTQQHAAAELAAEHAYVQIPSATVARDLDAYLANQTGLLGTTGDWRRVQYVVAKLRSYGLTPKVETVYPYYSTPEHVSVDMTAPTTYHAANKEACRSVETDCANEVVGYNALSPSGNVEGDVVYANYGTVEDYAQLAKLGVSVKGKIVLVRYGAVFRGVKPNLAAQHGAKATIIYSDPKDDGANRGAVYPDGPWRAPDGIQRGSVQRLWQYGGDPLTPGWQATRNAPRLDPSQANLAKIPSVPISYADATPMLKALGGPAVPASWQGGLPFGYHVGPGPTRAHVNLKLSYAIHPIWNVTATITGRSHPDQVVYVGGHRDAWTYGSDDNLSGAETVLQLGRAFGQLLATGWRPERSIRLATWDGEEYGLFGSTEHAEGQGTAQLGKVVAYVNMDGAAGRYFSASGVPSMDGLVRDTTKLVNWPGTPGSIYDDWSTQNGGGVPPIGRLGSGSDYTAFLDHFGVPSVNIGASTPSGDYHCSCDNFYMEDHFIDPGWVYHQAMAQEVGLVTMRLANADVTQLDYTPYAAEVQNYLHGFADQQQKAYGKQIVDVSADLRAAAAWQQAATGLQSRIDSLLAKGGHPAQVAAINARLELAERELLTPTGLPDRPWFRHQIYAPGQNQGYGTQTLPGLNDALFLDHDPAQAQRYADRLYASLSAAAATLSG